MIAAWLVLAIALAAISGLPMLAMRRGSARGQQAAVVLLWMAALCGAGVGVAALGGEVIELALPQPLPGLQPHLRLDAIGGAFLLPALLLPALAGTYGLGYQPAIDHPRASRIVGVFSGTMTAGMALLLSAGDGLTLLLGWETMALSGFLLVGTEDERAQARAASWIYLAATHCGTLLLVAFVATLQATTGSLALHDVGAVAPGAAAALFILGLLGFGMKAGIVPLHFWLPSAHAAAPSHVSAMLSGVMIKMGVYGVVRVTALLPAPPIDFGVALLAIGAVSAFVGVAFAIGQHDLKRLLAYHSIENIGIIFLGLGVALLGRARGDGALVALGLGGALLHVWNHALFKGLLFLAAGATVQRLHTHAIDEMGGVGRAMPRTAACFLVGALAISGLPPWNGFISELLVFLGLFRAPTDGPAQLALLAVPVLAMVGAMALLCFVKVFGAVYLGAPRSDRRAARDCTTSQFASMLALVLGCGTIGTLPWLAVPSLQGALVAWHGDPLPALATLAPLGTVSIGAIALVLAAVSGVLALRAAPWASGVGTWDCGYAAPDSPRIQYTARSFAQSLVGLLRWLLLPVRHTDSGGGLFAPARTSHEHVPDVVLDRLLLPAGRGLTAACRWLRGLQAGRVNLYLLYVFLTLLTLLLL